jgi:type I restriction enzyme S subunit
MKAEALLALYERVADAPDAIARLRRFVLDLAVRGKLVEQDAADEPASELLVRIDVQRTAVGLTNTQPRPRDSEAPFSLPSGWRITRLGDLCSKTGSGSTPRGGKTVYRTSGVAFLRSQNVHNDGIRLDDVAYIDSQTHQRMSGTQVLGGDLLLNITGGSIGRCARVPDIFCEANLSQHVAIIRPAVPDTQRFLHWLILSPYFQGFVIDEQTGAGRGGLPKNRMDRILVPLPPLAEQHRIVAKVDELMALLDRLEAARSAREATRDRLTTASLTRLTAPDTNPEALRTQARFALDALPALTTRTDQIKQLRQTILGLAVRGKLEDQGSAEQRLQPTPNTLPEIEGPFDVPDGWRWARLRDLGMLKGGGTPSKARDDYWSGSIPWVSPKDMKVDAIHQAQLSISEAAVSATAVHLIPARSVLFVVRGMILAHSFPVAISGVELTINQDMKALVLKPFVAAEYMLMALKGLKPEMLAKVQRSTHGTCRLEAADYADFPVPVPPLTAQHRIVAKVDELMAVCDRLEAALQSADTTRARLLEALLHEALAGERAQAA